MTFYLLRINMEVPVFFYYKFKCGTWWKRLASAQWRNVGRRWLRSPPAGAPSILLILISIFACPWLPYQIFGAPCKFLSIGHCIVNEYYLAPFAQKRCLRCSRGNHAYVTPLHISVAQLDDAAHWETRLWIKTISVEFSSFLYQEHIFVTRFS